MFTKKIMIYINNWLATYLTDWLTHYLSLSPDKRTEEPTGQARNESLVVHPPKDMASSYLNAFDSNCHCSQSKPSIFEGENCLVFFYVRALEISLTDLGFWEFLDDSQSDRRGTFGE